MLTSLDYQSAKPMSYLDVMRLAKIAPTLENISKVQDDLRVLIALGYIKPVFVNGEILYLPQPKIGDLQ